MFTLLLINADVKILLAYQVQGAVKNKQYFEGLYCSSAYKRMGFWEFWNKFAKVFLNLAFWQCLLTSNERIVPKKNYKINFGNFV